jgi:hypothetical protein
MNNSKQHTKHNKSELNRTHYWRQLVGHCHQLNQKHGTKEVPSTEIPYHMIKAHEKIAAAMQKEMDAKGWNPPSKSR